MFADRVLDQAEAKAREVGVSVARGVAMAIFAIVAASFLTTALWIYVSQAYDTLVAASTIGCLYSLAALVVMFAKPRRPVPPPTPKVGVDDLMQTFLTAFQVGRSSRR